MGKKQKEVGQAVGELVFIAWVIGELIQDSMWQLRGRCVCGMNQEG